MRNYMKGEMPNRLMALAVLPYFGSGVISGSVLRKNPLYGKAMVAYLKKINSERTLKQKLDIMISVIMNHKVKFALAFASIFLVLLLKTFL